MIEFFLSCEVFIGPENESYVYEVYDFNVNLSYKGGWTCCKVKLKKVQR